MMEWDQREPFRRSIPPTGPADRTADRPVERVSWNEVQDFLGRINGRIPGLDLALPTEVQWEHACRAGTSTALYSGDIAILGDNNAPALDPIAWYGGNSGVGFDLANGADSTDWPEMQYPHEKAGTHPVGRKRPNPWACMTCWGMCGNGAPTGSGIHGVAGNRPARPGERRRRARPSRRVLGQRCVVRPRRGPRLGPPG